MPGKKQKIEDGTFLAEEFDIPPAKAADLVTDDPSSEARIEVGVRKNLKQRDALEGVPTPRSSDDFAADNDETALKPVLHTPNERNGGG